MDSSNGASSPAMQLEMEEWVGLEKEEELSEGDHRIHDLNSCPNDGGFLHKGR